jgi:hypothetical protein
MIRTAIRRGLVACVLTCGLLAAEPVPVRHTEGVLRGFLAVSTMEGKRIAYGDLDQVAVKDVVTSRLVLHFQDGSVHNETAVFSQAGAFRLLSYHLVQSGPSFHQPVDLTFSTTSGQVTVHSADNGRDKVDAERMQLPADLANGLTLILLKNIRPDGPPTTVSILAATPKPQLVNLEMSAQGQDAFSFAGSPRKATHYVLRPKIGGATGVLATVLGKQPADIHVWVMGGDAPAFVKMEGPLYYGGPNWRIELATPVWPGAPGQRAANRPAPSTD